jgi:hypothetical protein
MPRFINPNAAALNDINKAKRKVVKRTKAKYATTEAEAAQTAEALAPTPSGDEKAFVSLYSKGTEVLATLEEVVSATKVFTQDAVSYSRSNPNRAFLIADDLISTIRDFAATINPLATKLSKDAGAALGALASMNYNISTLNDIEKDQIANLSASLHKAIAREYRRAFRLLKDAVDDPADRTVHEKWVNIARIYERFSSSVDTLDEQLMNAVKSYRQIPEGAGYRRGGARNNDLIPEDSSEERLTRGYGNQSPLAPIYSAFPPRRTQDLFEMPRRFQ